MCGCNYFVMHVCFINSVGHFIAERQGTRQCVAEQGSFVPQKCYMYHTRITSLQVKFLFLILAGAKQSIRLSTECASCNPTVVVFDYISFLYHYLQKDFFSSFVHSTKVRKRHNIHTMTGNPPDIRVTCFINRTYHRITIQRH